MEEMQWHLCVERLSEFKKRVIKTKKRERGAGGLKPAEPFMHEIDGTVFTLDEVKELALCS